MCGIVGLFLKDPSLQPMLGTMLTDMLITMTDRGPDSAGIAIYGDETQGKAKLTVQSNSPVEDFKGLEQALRKKIKGSVRIAVQDTHAVLEMNADQIQAARSALAEINPQVRIMSHGETLQIYKEVGLPRSVAERFDLRSMGGDAWHRPYPHGDGICCDHDGRASL